MIRYDHYTDKFVKVSDRECPWCKAVCASTDKYCHECGWHIADAPQTDLLVKTPHKSRESHEKNCETCRDKDAYDEWQGNCDECENGSMYTPQTDEFKNFDREDLILLIECQKERIGELLADKDIPQTKAVVKPYKPTNREILDAIENSDCPWK